MKFGARWAAVAVGVFTASTMVAQDAFAYQEGDVAGGGSIKGKVLFEGPLPVDAKEEIVIAKNPEICGTGTRQITWVDVKDGALRGAFVFIDKIEKGKPWPKEFNVYGPGEGQQAVKTGTSPIPVVNQKNCRFNPWAQVIKPGPIIIRHQDPGALHNINTRELIGVKKGRRIVKRTLFNFGQPDPGDIEETLTTRRSPFIAINCEAHNFMFGFMMAPKHPYAVVVGEDGSFTIDNVPPGEYTVKSWHPRYKLKSAKVTVSGGGAAEATFKFSDSDKI